MRKLTLVALLSGATVMACGGRALHGGDAATADSTGAADARILEDVSLTIRCGDANCVAGVEACLYCQTPIKDPWQLAPRCVSATAEVPQLTLEECGFGHDNTLTLVYCTDQTACPDTNPRCMWTAKFGFATIECGTRACSATCSCEPNLRQLCNTLADCPPCATRCTSELEDRVGVKTCKAN